MLGWLGIGLIFVGILAGGAWAYLFEIPGLVILSYALFSGYTGALFQTAAPYAMSAAAPIIMSIGTGAFAALATSARNIIGGG